MPTPVATAMQCLSPEAGQALDEAVNAAKRRGHGQTTSLHAVSALLTLPSSPLPDACFRSRNSAYSYRVQFKAMELCLTVSLDRVPTSGQPGADPPVSNSLMAAIKRSQANQRRQPERFHLYNSQLHDGTSPSGFISSVSCIKVELRNLILSILDDPVVSRVFAESGFRSSDIKAALLKPFSHTFRSPRPPTVVSYGIDAGNLENSVMESGSSFGQKGCSIGRREDIWRVIGELLVREKRNNPVMVGACAFDVLKAFSNFVGSRKEMNFSPLELSGIQIIELASDVRTFLSGSTYKDQLEMKLKRVGHLILEESSSLGVILNLGDLKEFVRDEKCKEDNLGHLVCELSSLLGFHGLKRIWITGALEKYETYFKLVTSFPSVEMEWDLQLFPVSSSSTSSPMSEPYQKPSIVELESCPPSDRYFPTPSDSYGAVSSSYQQNRCSICDEKLKQEVATTLKNISVADQYQSCLPSWLQMVENKARDNNVLLSAKIVSLQKKWDDICCRLHSEPAPAAIGIQCPPAMAVKSSILLSNRFEISSRRGESGFRKRDDVCQASFLFTKSKTSDLELKLTDNLEPKLSVRLPNHGSSDVEFINGGGTGNVSDQYLQSTSSCSSDIHGQSDEWEFKKLFSFLTEKVSWQNEAILDICRVMPNRSRKRNDVWLHFLGPDKQGKEKLAMALAEARCGSKKNIFVADFASFSKEHEPICYFDEASRGKMLIDYIANELRKKTPALIFLQNIDKADLQTQKALTSGADCGKFLDSHGREVSVHNAVFITTSLSAEEHQHKTCSYRLINYSEERVVGAKGWPLELVVDDAKSFVSSKRKVAQREEEICEQPKRVRSESWRNLDLNLPAETPEREQIWNCNSPAEAASMVWLKEYLDLVGRIHFKQFDFDSLAKRLSKEINQVFHKIAGMESSLHIDPKAMEQLLAAAYTSSRKRVVEDWVDQVLGWGVVQAVKKFNVDSHVDMRLVVCEGNQAEESNPVYLPRKIIISSEA